MQNFVIISGCSGGGKSSLLAELQRRGHPVVEEAGRRVVRSELQSSGDALPWIDMARFAQLAITMAQQDWRRAQEQEGWVVFDRSVVDVAAALETATGEAGIAERLERAHSYHSRVFMAPPWPEVFNRDDERRHDFDAATAEYDQLCDVYSGLGYELIFLPKVAIAERASWLESMLLTNPPCRD